MVIRFLFRMIREVVTSLTLQIVSRWFRYYHQIMLCVTRAYHGDILEELDIVEGLEEGLDVDSLVGQVVHSVVSLQGLLQRGDKGAQLIKILGQICFFLSVSFLAGKMMIAYLSAIENDFSIMKIRGEMVPTQSRGNRACQSWNPPG
jgi:hypothetical protein